MILVWGEFGLSLAFACLSFGMRLVCVWYFFQRSLLLYIALLQLRSSWA